MDASGYAGKEVGKNIKNHSYSYKTFLKIRNQPNWISGENFSQEMFYYSYVYLTMKASDIFVKMLESYGVDRIYGVPGEENLDFLESLRTSSIELILTRNEQTAVFMAANHGRFTGQPGVALATLGPGATNMVTGVAYAQLSGLPLIVITGQKPIKKSKQ